MQTYKINPLKTLPSKAELEKKFSFVSSLFDGREWTNYNSVIGQGTEVILKHFGCSISSDDAIKEMATAGYRPATHLELIALHENHPDLYKEFWMVALGSFALGGDDSSRRVAVLCASDGRPCLGDRWFDGDWDDGRRLPFVPQGSSGSVVLGTSALSLGHLDDLGFSTIVKWLYENDGGYKDKVSWRKAFLGMLETLKQ